jgi:hypothetical protein
MHKIQHVGDHTLYGGMRLLHTPCDVFQDNPLFSELIFDNPMNPGRAKHWGRFVRQTGQANCAFVPGRPGTWQDYDRLNNLYHRRSGGQDFDQLWGGWRAVEAADHLPWLICEPRDEILQYWYGLTLADWRHQVTSRLRELAHDWHTRPKPIRSFRMNQGKCRVIHCAGQYRGVITAHSVSAIDAILAGRPAVIWGQDPTCGTGTPWGEFESQGQARLPSLDQVQTAACTWASTTYNISDLEQAITCVMK